MNSKPKVIRKVITRFKDAKRKGQPKVVRDRRTDIDVELVYARSVRVCAYRGCPHPDRAITGAYLNVTDFGHPRNAVPIGGRMIVKPQSYHPDCVPHEARPLVRFLIPTPWKMTLVEDSSQRVKSWRFTSSTAWLAAMDKHYPEMRMRYISDPGPGRGMYQVGTDYHYSMLEYKPRPFER